MKISCEALYSKNKPPNSRIRSRPLILSADKGRESTRRPKHQVLYA
jgi:hypothetical protein